MKIAALACLLALLPLTAQAQLTPSTQALWACAHANRYKPYDSGDAAAIATACGSASAVASTISGGQSALDSVVTLRATARSLWMTYVKTQTH